MNGLNEFQTNMRSMDYKKLARVSSYKMISISTISVYKNIQLYKMKNS